MALWFIGLGTRPDYAGDISQIVMNRALVLACGNTLRGDDGIAILLARYLRSEFCEPQTDILTSQQWTPDLAELISQSGLVLFLDASASLPPGLVQLRKIEPMHQFPSCLTHSMSPEALLALAAKLYSSAPENAYLLTIGGKFFDHAEQLSEPVRSAIPHALDQIKAVLSGVSLPQIAPHSQRAAS